MSGRISHVEGEEAGERGRSHFVAAAQETGELGTDDRRRAGDIGPHLGGEVGDLIPGQQIAAEAEAQHQTEQRDAAQPGQLARPAVRVQEHDAEHMDEGDEDDEVRRPAMDGADEPAELHVRHDELHAVEGLGDRGAIVEQQQDSGHHLDDEQEQRDAAEVIPGSGGMHGDSLVARNSRGMRRPSRSSNHSKVLFSVPWLTSGSSSRYTRFEMTTSSPRTLTACSSSGAGAVRRPPCR